MGLLILVLAASQASALDVYSFGILLIVLRLNRRPYGDLSAFEIIDGVRHHKMRPLLPENPAVFPPRLRALVRSCLQEEPQSRCGDGGIVQNAMLCSRTLCLFLCM